MKKTPEQIASEITRLLSELVEMADGSFRVGKSGIQISLKKRETGGATGGLRVLISEGHFDQPKQLNDIAELLRQEGRHYSSPTVSMGLLNLVRERALVRIKDKNTKNWTYVVRR